jgi:hypothetical protein
MSSEPAGRINVLSQDCFASPGVLVAGLGGVGLGVYPANFVVSTLQTQLAGVSTFTTPDFLITETSTPNDPSNLIGVSLIPDADFGSEMSNNISFQAPFHANTGDGISQVYASEIVGAPVAVGPCFVFDYISTSVAPYSNIRTGSLCPDSMSGSSIMGVSSINGINWAQISTVAANY